MESESILIPEIADTLMPQSMLDAGGEGWDTLREILARCLDLMASGEVLEVISSRSEVRAAVTPWCGQTGHELLGSREDGAKASFWIRKR
jgi:TusA-related sulfurtransferase